MLVEMINNTKVFYFQVYFSKKPIIIDDITKRILIKIKITPILNIYEQPLKNHIFGDEDENEYNKYDKLTYDGDNTQHDGDYGTENDDTDTLTDDKRIKIGKNEFPE